jgi:hypothetical protein
MLFSEKYIFVENYVRTLDNYSVFQRLLAVSACIPQFAGLELTDSPIDSLSLATCDRPVFCTVAIA